MKKIFFLFLSIITFAVQAQECSDVFIVEVAKLFNNKEKAFNKKVNGTLKEHAVDIKDIETIIIAEMFVTKKGDKKYRGYNADKEDLVCYLNKKKLRFDQSFVFSDAAIIGVINRFNKNDTKFHDASNSYSNHLLPFMLEIKKIAPDFIFRIYNMPLCHWYVKNNQLYVLMYENIERELKDFKAVTADEYIKNYINETDLIYLSQTNRTH